MHVENTQNDLSVSYVLYYQRTQQFHKSTLNIQRTATSTKRALPKLIDNAPVLRARKPLEGLNSLISRSPKHPGTPAPRAHTTPRRSRDLQICVQLKHTFTFSKANYQQSDL